MKVYYRGCAVESHMIPPYEGRAMTLPNPPLFGGEPVEGGSQTVPGTESVADVCDRFDFDPGRGGTLVRTVRCWRYETAGGLPTGGAMRTYVGNNTRDNVIISPEDVPDVLRIEVDGVQVWPEGGGDLAELRSLADELLSGEPGR